MDKAWLEKCATAGEFLYGYYSVAVLKQMYEKKRGFTASTADIIETMKASKSVLMTYMEGKLDDYDSGEGFFAPVECEGTSLEKVMKKADADGNPYALLHIDEDERMELLGGQADVDYYIPTEKEITQLVDEGYIRTPAMTALEERIKSFGSDPGYLQKLWGRISTNKLDVMEGVSAVMEGAFKSGDGVPSMDDLNAIMPLVNDFMNNINHRDRRGWAPNKLRQKMGPIRPTTIVPGSVRAAKNMKEIEGDLRTMGVNVDYSTIDNFETIGKYGERRIVKVGRNDPCPCGSGKKYKRCHGR